MKELENNLKSFAFVIQMAKRIWLCSFLPLMFARVFMAASLQIS